MLRPLSLRISWLLRRLRHNKLQIRLELEEQTFHSRLDIAPLPFSTTSKISSSSQTMKPMT